jgi:hypothetical protein
MGELRQLHAEWNELVNIARENHVSHIILNEAQRRVKVMPIKQFAMRREEARDRVLSLRARVAQLVVRDDGVVELIPAFGQNFGIELETFMPRTIHNYDMAEFITQAGVVCKLESNAHARCPYWTIVRDGSLSGGGGIEVRSPFPPLKGQAGLNQVRKVCNVLTEKGCRVNKKTGLHVHVDARGKPLHWFKNLYRMYHRWESAIDSFMAPSRRGENAPTWQLRNDSYYCQSLECNWEAFEAAETFAQVCVAVKQPGTNARAAARYKKLNFLAFIQFGTAEFRQHQGTTEPHKTEMWVRLLLKMTDKANTTSKEEIEGQEATLEGMLKFLDADQVERNYFVERRNYFAAQLQAQGAMR